MFFFTMAHHFRRHRLTKAKKPRLQGCSKQSPMRKPDELRASKEVTPPCPLERCRAGRAAPTPRAVPQDINASLTRAAGLVLPPHNLPRSIVALSASSPEPREGISGASSPPAAHPCRRLLDADSALGRGELTKGCGGGWAKRRPGKRGLDGIALVRSTATG